MTVHHFELLRRWCGLLFGIGRRPGAARSGARSLSKGLAAPVYVETLESRGLLSAPPLTFVDGDGTTVTITLSGNGSFVLNEGNLTITGSDQGTKLSISTKGGDGRTTLGSIQINGAINSISASKTDLTGGITLGGSAKTFKLGNMLAGSQKTITIGGTPNAKPVSLEFGRVQDMTIDSKSPISYLRVVDWDDTDGNDLVRAPLLKKVNSDEDLATGGIIVSDEEGAGVLGNVYLKGTMSGTWFVDGKADYISTWFTSESFRMNIRGKLGKLYARYDMSGLVATYDVGNLTVKGAVINATVLAGADLGADIALGGSGADQDLFFRGTFGTLSVSQTITASTFGAGLDPANGVIGDSDDFITGKSRSTFKTIRVSGLADTVTTFAAGKFGSPSVGGTRVDPNGDPRFLLASTAPEETPPLILAQLRNNTGDPNDLITSDPSIIGRVTDLGPITSFRIGIDDDELSEFVSIHRFIEYDGTFELLRSDIEKINKGPFTTFEDDDEGDPGQLKIHTINLVAKDDIGNTSAIYRVPFIFVP